MKNKNLETLKAVLDQYTIEERKKMVVPKDIEFSDEFKRKMNRFFKEHIKSDKIPHPEVEQK